VNKPSQIFVAAGVRTGGL